MIRSEMKNTKGAKTMFEKLFDFNRDGKLDASERAFAYMLLQAVIEAEEGIEDDLDDDED